MVPGQRVTWTYYHLVCYSDDIQVNRHEKISAIAENMNQDRDRHEVGKYILLAIISAGPDNSLNIQFKQEGEQG